MLRSIGARRRRRRQSSVNLGRAGQRLQGRHETRSRRVRAALRLCDGA